MLLTENYIENEYKNVFERSRRVGYRGIAGWIGRSGDPVVAEMGEEGREKEAPGMDVEYGSWLL